VKRCKQQNWKDLQARHHRIRNRLSADLLRIIRPGKNRRDLGHVQQLFRHACVAQALLPVPMFEPQAPAPQRHASATENFGRRTPAKLSAYRSHFLLRKGATTQSIVGMKSDGESVGHAPTLLLGQEDLGILSHFGE
jgi:hypothetical protein